MTKQQQLIDGAWVDALDGGRWDVIDPATEEVVASVPFGGAADAFGEGPGPLACNIHEFRIRGNLIQHGQDTLRFREQAAVEVGFELQQSVVDPQPVVAHAAQDQVHMFLLACKSLEDL